MQLEWEGGFDLRIKLPPRDNPPAIILMTACDEHAVKASEAEALDSLTKPVPAELLAKSLRCLDKKAPHPPCPHPRRGSPQLGSLPFSTPRIWCCSRTANGGK